MNDLTPEDLLAALAGRYSVGPKQMEAPAPTPEHLRLAAQLALRAPDHLGLHPFRFVSVATEQRAALGELFARAAQRRGLDDSEVAAARRRAHNGPALLAVIGRLREDVDDVPLHEQWMCIGGAVMNLLNALHLLGYGAKVVSGSSVRDAEVRDAFCAPSEVLVAWVIAGTPTRSTHARHDERVDDLLTDWLPGASGAEARA